MPAGQGLDAPTGARRLSAVPLQRRTDASLFWVILLLSQARNRAPFLECFGSNRATPASQSGLSIFRVTVRKEAHNYGAFRASFSLWGSRIRTKISFWCGKSLAFSYEMAVLQSQKVETGSIFH